MSNTCKIIGCNNSATWNSHFCFDHREDAQTCDENGCDNETDGKMDVCGDCYREKMSAETSGDTFDDDDSNGFINTDTAYSAEMTIDPSDDFIEWLGGKYGDDDNESDADTHVLDDAADAVYERADTHGAEDCFGTIADMWATYLDTDVDEGDVCNMMILLKVARNKEGVYTDDNWEDIAGYSESGARCTSGSWEDE